jgi:tetratricopeptide (TPR) repeat protein
MTTIASGTSNGLPIVTTPRERFNIVEHSMWKDYYSSDEDEYDEHQLLSMADLGTEEDLDHLGFADLDASGIDTSDTTHIVDLTTVFDNEIVDHDFEAALEIDADIIDADIIDPILTDDDSEFDEDYEEEEEYAQRDDIEEDNDDDFVEFMNMNRIMQNQQVVTKHTWRHRQQLVDYGLFKCACACETDIHAEDIVDVAADCKDKCFTEPEGLFALAVMHSAIGDTYCRNRKQLEAEPAYEMAIALSPYNAPCYLDYAQILETCYDDLFHIAEQAYVKAIDIHENVLAMYNLAGLHLRAFNIQKGETERLDKAIHYYSIACDWGDIASSSMACMLLYTNYPEKVEEFAYRFNRLGHNNNQRARDGRMFANFLEEIGPINLYERLKAAPNGQYTTKCLSEIASHRHVSPYVAKVALFTRLNHVTECGICYDEKLNIDLQCGHTTCTDCYKRVYMNECPFCRFEFH